MKSFFFYMNSIFLSYVFPSLIFVCSILHLRFITHLFHIWTPHPSYPVPSLFQSTCDTLRSHSDSLGFAPNVLPSHPSLGNFEEFACWWRRRPGQLGSDNKLWFEPVYLYIKWPRHSMLWLAQSVSSIHK